MKAGVGGKSVIRKKRWLQVAAMLVVGVLLVTLIIGSLIEDTGAYLVPSQIDASRERWVGSRVVVGGWVQAGSWSRKGLEHQFFLVDDDASLLVKYTGIVPDLFAESEVAVATGRFVAEGYLAADQVLARHDENYRPPGLSE
ncbi:MAG: cytochrome c maturation protein CcmE [Gammaproteobacteria bacterium]